MSRPTRRQGPSPRSTARAKSTSRQARYDRQTSWMILVGIVCVGALVWLTISANPKKPPRARGDNAGSALLAGDIPDSSQDPRFMSLATREMLTALRLDQAATNIQFLMDQHPDYPETWLLQGRLLILQKNYTEAEPALRRHLELEPSSVQGTFQLGMALLRQDRYDEAAAIYQKATQLQPDFGPAYFNQGFALARSGQLQASVVPFEEAIRQNPEHVESYVLLADVYQRLGDLTNALAQVVRADAISPGHPRIEQVRSRLQLALPQE